MNTRGSMVVLGALALFAQAFGARAAGTITSVTLNPPTTVTYNPVAITVNASGICPLSVSFGDGQHLLELRGPGQHINFPVTVHHRYAKPGPYRVEADGGECGTISNTLQVTAGPRIDSIVSASEVTPGAEVVLLGENFGSATGQVEITVPRFAGPIPSVNDLQIIHWGDTVIIGTIPQIEAVPAGQRATFTVIANCGARSDPGSTAFTPTLDVADLADHTDRLDCKTSVGASVSDRCLGWGGNQWPIECGNADWGGAPSSDLGGYHASGWGTGGVGGWDWFWVTAPLQNGWVLNSASADWTRKVGDVSTASEDPNTTASPGAPSPFMGVNWYVGNCGMVFYSGHMIITGPLGVPF